MKIRHLGEKTVDALISGKRILHPEDVYAGLTIDDLKEVKGIGSKKRRITGKCHPGEREQTL